MDLRTIFRPAVGDRGRNGHSSGIELLLPSLEPTGLPYDEALQRLAAGRKVIVASNRGPVEFSTCEDGKVISRRGAGGVATLLGALAHAAPFTWVVSPMGDADRQAAAQAENGRVCARMNGSSVQLCFVTTEPDVFERFYGAFANPLLWFLQHNMWDLLHSPAIGADVYDAWERGYVPVNQAFAEAVIQEIEAAQLNGETASKQPVVLFQDYHLYLAPGYVRERAPDAILQQFIHIPWPAPRSWSVLPETMRGPIIRNLCQNDIVGFQTSRDALNFLLTCQAFLPDAVLDFRSRSLQWGGRTVFARDYAASVDVTAVQETADSAEAAELRTKLEPLRGEYTIVRVDRLEPSKNIVRGFQAFDGLLTRYPELTGRVKFWAFLVPSRTEMKIYKDYKKEVFSLIDQINERHGSDAWRPIEVFYENNYEQALAAMSLYDVLLVNPVMDGMNLVAKEGPTVNQRDGVLILSEGAGAHEQLARHALSVGPTDVEGTLRALYEAITMPHAERKYRADKLRETIAKDDLDVWVRAQVRDLVALLDE